MNKGEDLNIGIIFGIVALTCVKSLKGYPKGLQQKTLLSTFFSMAEIQHYFRKKAKTKNSSKQQLYRMTKNKN